MARESTLGATAKEIRGGKLALIKPVTTSTLGRCVEMIRWIPVTRDGDPPDHLHAAAQRRCRDGLDQGQLPAPYLLRRRAKRRLARHPGSAGCGEAAAPSRHALPVAG